MALEDRICENNKKKNHELEHSLTLPKRGYLDLLLLYPKRLITNIQKKDSAWLGENRSLADKQTDV